MNMKEELLQLREKIIKKGKKKEESEKKDTYELNDKVEEFIQWYKNNRVKEFYTDIGEYHLPNDMRNFIEKIAVWYELRYPDDKVNLVLEKNQELKNMENILEMEDILEQDNKKMNQDDDSEVYSVKSFYDALSYEEKLYLMQPCYRSILYWNGYSQYPSLHLSKNGIVEKSKCMDAVIPEISNKDLEGKNIKEVMQIIREKGIIIPELNEFIPAIQEYDKTNYQREGILNCAMYRIIERGGNRIGPRRAFLFAKEFGRDIRIPMRYAIDYSDPGLRVFINEYIKAGGSKDLECLVGYFSRTSKDEPLKKVSIQELILTRSNDAYSFYTEEENELHQRLIHSLKKAKTKKTIKMN